VTALPRLSRLLAADGRCLDVAIDHGFFGEAAFLTGIENMPRVLDALIEAAPDAIQLSPGMARLYGARPGPKPALVLRTDVANVYHPVLPDLLFSESIAEAVETAVRLDAAAVVVNLLRLPGEPDVLRQCIAHVNRLRPECERLGMPLMVEPLVMRTEGGTGGYLVDGDIDLIVPLVRQAVELGADIIKADPCDELSEYHRVIETAAGVPVLVRGGGRLPTEELLRRTAEVMGQGASGIVYGRNIVQHPDPPGITRALMAIVHAGASPQDALEHVAGGSAA
jgi:class I fructose-bisphosphate aldolase